jgi:hypothetical protein
MTFVPLVYLALIIASVYNWKTHNNVLFYWLIYPLSLMFVAPFVSYMLKTVFSFGPIATGVIFYALLLLRILAFIAFFVILLKKDFRADRDKFGRIISFPTRKKNGYNLSDVADLTGENSGDLAIPTESEIKGLRVGDSVKLQFNTATNIDSDRVLRERMWVVIEAIEPTFYMGRLHNTSTARAGPSQGTILKFKVQNILEVNDISRQ